MFPSEHRALAVPNFTLSWYGTEKLWWPWSPSYSLKHVSLHIQKKGGPKGTQVVAQNPSRIQIAVVAPESKPVRFV